MYNPDIPILHRLKSQLTGLIKTAQPRRTPIDGLPAGLEYPLLRQVISDWFDVNPVEMAYLRITNWRLSGAYRIFIKDDAGNQLTLIYKNAVYSPERTPGLRGFPSIPGAPEHSIYRMAREPLKKYLPHVYYSQEVIPGIHYQYLLEDLVGEYRRPISQTDKLNIANLIPELHRAMAEWLHIPEPVKFLAYDLDYAKRLQNYVHDHFENYLEDHSDRRIHHILRHWPEMCALLEDEDYFTIQTPGPIHGDFRPLNILIHRRDPERIKLVDWEWAGIGLAQNDLASLLWRVSSETERRALMQYAHRVPNLTLEEHERLYWRCRIERGLQEAAIIAAQMTAEPHTLVGKVDRELSAAASQVLNAFENLQGGY
jgi:Phosphotransferase enzyme family